MKISIKREEIRQLLSNALKMDVEDFTIEAGDPSNMGRALRGLADSWRDEKRLIPRLRTLRNFGYSVKVNYSIAECKWMIEHWPAIVSFSDEYNRLPSPGFADPLSLGILV